MERHVGHLALHYAPGDERPARRLLELLGCTLLDNGPRPGEDGFCSVLVDGPTATFAENLMFLNVLFAIGSLLLVTSIVLELWRCPPPDGISKIWIALEIIGLWIAMPLLGFVLGMVPAIEAQTRLMFGVPLGYKVTPKRFVGAAKHQEAA